MIHQALNTILSEIAPFLNIRLGNAQNNAGWIVQGNVVGQNGTPPANNNRKVIASVVNMEEDRISRSWDIHRKQLDGTIATTKPEIRFNFYLLFAAYFPEAVGGNTIPYSDGLRALSGIISFFQQKNVFDKKNTPTLPDNFEKLIVEHYSLTLEQQNHLWGALGAKYLPSVMYKIRLIVFQEDTMLSSGPPISTIDIQPENIHS